MNSEICLSCEAIERYLGEEEERVHALCGVSLEIEAGSVHAVVGPSGCGKSSLLYVLGLLDLPDTGRVSKARHTNRTWPKPARAGRGGGRAWSPCRR